MAATPEGPLTCLNVSPGPTCRAVATVQDEVVEDIEEQPDNPSAEDQQRLRRLLGIDIPFDGLDQDAEHQGHGKNGVAKSPHDVRPQKAERALPVLGDAAGPQAEQAYHHGQQVREYGEGVRGQGQRVAEVGDRELHHEEQDAQDAHEDEAEAAARVPAHGSRLLALGSPAATLAFLGRPESSGRRSRRFSDCNSWKTVPFSLSALVIFGNHLLWAAIKP